MNMRVPNLFPETPGTQPQNTELVIDPQNVASQPSGKTVDYETILNTAYSAKKQDPMQEALERLRQERAAGKEEQMKQDWEKMEDRNQGIYKGMHVIAEESAYNAKRNDFNAGQQQVVETLSRNARIEKKQQINTAFQKHEHASLQEAKTERQFNERKNALEAELLNTQEELQEAYRSGNEQAVANLQAKERDGIARVNMMRFVDPSLHDGSYQKAQESVSQKAQESDFNAQYRIVDSIEQPNSLQPVKQEVGLGLVEDANILETNQGVKGLPSSRIIERVPAAPVASETPQDLKNPESKNFAPSQMILEELNRLGMRYQDVQEKIPNFATMSEGQQAYVISKAEQQSIEHIQSKTDALFQDKTKKAGWFTRNFRKGALRREAVREAATKHVGLDAYLNDMTRLTTHVHERGLPIHLNEKNEYIIEYQAMPEGLSPNDPEYIRYNQYNRAATVLSDIPYEWTLPTASSRERKAFQSAYKEFQKQEAILQNGYVQAREKNGDKQWDDGNILNHMHQMRTMVEFDQFFSTYPDVQAKLYTMKNLDWFTGVYGKFTNPATLSFMVGSQAGRWISRSMLGLGGAAGAGLVIGGIMGWRKKKAQFTEDAKQVRRGSELKDTTKKVFEADKNTARIYKLLTQLEKEQDPVRRERTLTALEDRLMLLDERIKEGRVNFGKSKDQIKNKQELITAIAAAHEYRISQTDEMKQIQGRVLEYFDAQDFRTQKNRNKDMARAIAIGAGIGTIAGAIGYCIGDYIRNLPADAQAAQVPPTNLDAVSGRTPFVPPVEESVMSPAQTTPTDPTDFEISVDASPRGAIATFADLQEQLRMQYPDMSQAPDYIQEFMSKTPTELAIEENMYRPSEVEESAKIYKGGKLGFNKSGQLVYTDARTGVDILSGDGKFDGGHFDYGARQAPHAAPASTGAPTGGFDYRPDPATGVVDAGPDTSSLQQNPDTSYTVNNDRVMGPNEEAVQRAKTSVADELLENASLGESVQTAENSILLYGKVPISYEIVDVRGGKDYIDFKNIDFNALKGIEKPYIRSGMTTDSFVDKIMVNEDFLTKHPDMSREKVVKDLNFMIRQYALRDQVLQEGDFSDSRKERRILTRELEQIRKQIGKLFEKYAEDTILVNSDGPKYPNTTEFVGQEPAATAETPNIAENATQQATPAQETVGKNIRTLPKTEPINPDNVRAVPDTQVFSGLKVEVMRDALGRITGINPLEANIDIDKLSLGEYVQNRDWLPEYGQSKEKALQQLQILKGNIALRDAFPQGGPEYAFMQSKIEQDVATIAQTYPGLLEGGADGSDVVNTPTENPSLRTAPVETQGPAIAETSTLSGVSNEFLRDVTYRVSKDVSGNIVRIENDGTVITNGINLQQIGFNPNWRTDSGLPQTFLDRPEGQKVEFKLETIKRFVGLQSAFEPNSPEFNYYADQIATMKNTLDTQYPAMFQ